MSDLSNLLGDLYGDSSNPDGPPVRHEPAAAERSEWSARRTDDDLAAALSAALAEPPVAPAMPAAPMPAPAMPEAYAPQVEFSAPAPAPAAPAMPTMPVMPIAQQAPVAPVAPARGAWTAAPAEMPAPVAVAVAPAPVAAPVMPAGPRMWARGDDDIFPIAGGAKKKRK
ncbi:MAG TPA: hypothetical protein VM345_07110 [Acidimicrobiales bacterium]|nr:hypothetical protein [Acidimicrobiales bacterium]